MCATIEKLRMREGSVMGEPEILVDWFKSPWSLVLSPWSESASPRTRYGLRTTDCGLRTSYQCSPGCSHEPPVAPAFPPGHVAVSVVKDTILAAAPVGRQSPALAESIPRRVCRPTGSPPGTTGSP